MFSTPTPLITTQLLSTFSHVQFFEQRNNCIAICVFGIFVACITGQVVSKCAQQKLDDIVDSESATLRSSVNVVDNEIYSVIEKSTAE